MPKPPILLTDEIVFSANGYYDAVTPFFQTIVNFENMPLINQDARNNLTIKNYPPAT